MESKNQLIETIIAFIDKENIIPKGSRIILGLSGGPDSVFLFHLLLELQKRKYISTFIAGHLDHEWRTHSEKDAQFCQDLALKHAVPFESEKLSQLPISLTWEGSQEALGRKARRFFFESLALKYNAQAIALGHHAQDQQETFFIRLLRGTSLTGLCGIWPKRGLYVRPLLQTNKADIVEYLNAHSIDYLEDPSNKELTFLRNRIRSTVLPALKATDQRFDTSFKQTIQRLQDIEQYLELHTQKLFDEMSTKDNGIIQVSRNKLLEYPPIMQSRLIVYWLKKERVSFPVTQQFIDEILRFIESPRGGTHHIHDNWSIFKQRGMFNIKKT